MTADALRRTPFNPGARAQRAARKPGPTHLSGRQPARSQPCAPRWARAYAPLPPGHSPACRLADPGRPAPVAHTSSTLMRSHPSLALPQARGAHFGRLVDGKGLLDRRADGRTVRSDRPGCAGRCPVHGSGDSCRRHALPVPIVPPSNRLLLARQACSQGTLVASMHCPDLPRPCGRPWLHSELPRERARD